MAPLGLMPSFSSPCTYWSKLALTTSESNGLPSLKVTSLRRWKVNSVRSLLYSQDSASHGVISPVSGSCQVSLSVMLLPMSDSA